MVVYLILYGAGVLFASSVHYYMSRMSLILAALYLYFYDYRRSGNPFHLRALFSLFWVGGEGISCFKLSRLQTDWDPVTWASFFIALAAFWSVFGLAEARIRKKREEGKDKREEKARRKGVEAVSEGTEAAGSFGRLTAILLLTAVSWAAFLLEAAVLGYVPFFLRGVPHAYSHFHISGVHYFTVSCVLVPSMAVIWFLRGGVKKRWQAVLDNDRRYDGAFFYGVASTGIFCRPSCPSRPPRRDRVRFFPTADAALAAGFRPCKRCRPDLTDFSPGQEVAAEAMALLHRHFRDQADLSAALNGLGLSRRRLADLFQAAYGTTLHGCLGTLRVTEACRLLRETDQPVAQIAGEAGFDSLSAFYRAFRSGTGQSPLAYRRSAHSAPDKSSGPC